MTDTEREEVPYSDDQVLALSDLFWIFWKDKWVVIGITVSVTLTALSILFLLPNIYRSEALVAPNQEQSGGGLTALASQYGALANLAGISIGDKSTDKIVLGLEILQSRQFLTEFIQRHDILVPLMAAKDWNPDSGELEIDSNIYDTQKETWVRDARGARKTIPSMQEAYEEITRRLSVSHSKNTGFVVIGIEHLSPIVAKQWVDWLIADINSTIMSQDVSEAEQAIEYLNQQAEATSLAELRSVFFSLIKEQIKTIVLARISDEYLFKTVDPAVVPEKKIKPKRLLLTVLAVFLGLTIGAVVVIAMNVRRS